MRSNFRQVNYSRKEIIRVTKVFICGEKFYYHMTETYQLNSATGRIIGYLNLISFEFQWQLFVHK